MDDAARRALEALYIQATQDTGPDFDLLAHATIEVNDAAGTVTFVPMAKVLAELRGEAAEQPTDDKPRLARAA